MKEGGKVNQVIQLDVQKRLLLKFVIKNKQTSKPVLVHQAFVSFVHEKLKHEAIFIASSNKKDRNEYTIDLVSFKFKFY